MNEAFDKAFAYLMLDEGTVYTNTPGDAGGPTKYGVTLHEYSYFVGRLLNAQDIEHLTEEDAKRFYWVKYWNSRTIPFDQICNYAVACCIFDSSVLYGASTAARIAQKVLSMDHVDGIIGPKTLEVLNSSSPTTFIHAYRMSLLSRIDGIVAANPVDTKFKKGWVNRANRLLTLVA